MVQTSWLACGGVFVLFFVPTSESRPRPPLTCASEVVYYVSERKSMSKSVEESGAYKSTAITCAKRLAEFLGASAWPRVSRGQGRGQA